MAKLFANSGDPDQMPHSVASDLGLHCSPITLLQVSRLQWANDLYAIFFFFFFIIIFFIKAYVVGTHLNCINKLMQFKWVPTTYASIKK